MDTITVTRTKVYPSKAYPGPAWKWVYTVAIPGEPYTFSGEGLAWVDWLSKKKAPHLRIVRAWESNVRLKPCHECARTHEGECGALVPAVSL